MGALIQEKATPPGTETVFWGGSQQPPNNRQRWQKTLSVVEGRVAPPRELRYFAKSLNDLQHVRNGQCLVLAGGRTPAQPTAVAKNSVGCRGCPSTPCNRPKLYNHPDKKESASEAIDDGSASGLNDWKSLHRRIKKQRRYEPLPACKRGLTRHQDTLTTQRSDELLGVWVLI